MMFVKQKIKYVAVLMISFCLVATAAYKQNVIDNLNESVLFSNVVHNIESDDLPALKALRQQIIDQAIEDFNLSEERHAFYNTLYIFQYALSERLVSISGAYEERFSSNIRIANYSFLYDLKSEKALKLEEVIAPALMSDLRHDLNQSFEQLVDDYQKHGWRGTPTTVDERKAWIEKAIRLAISEFWTFQHDGYIRFCSDRSAIDNGFFACASLKANDYVKTEYKLAVTDEK